MQTITLTQLMVLDKADFAEVIQMFPQLRKSLVRFAAQRRRRNARNMVQQLERVRYEAQWNRALLSFGASSPSPPSRPTASTPAPNPRTYFAVGKRQLMDAIKQLEERCQSPAQKVTPAAGGANELET